MGDLCSRESADYKELRVKIVRFLKSRSADAVTGYRRMERSELVDLTRSICDEIDIPNSVYPDISGSIVIFYHWNDMEGVLDDLLLKKPDIDIIFGQDLCHQVPAIVRFKK
jgi:hypothetical protein